jgi:hypothetical protein
MLLEDPTKTEKRILRHIDTNTLVSTSHRQPQGAGHG